MGRVSTWVAPRGRTPPTLGVLGSGGRRAVQAGSLRPLGGRGNEIDTDSKAQRRPRARWHHGVERVVQLIVNGIRSVGDTLFDVPDEHRCVTGIQLCIQHTPGEERATGVLEVVDERRAVLGDFLPEGDDAILIPPHGRIGATDRRELPIRAAPNGPHADEFIEDGGKAPIAAVAFAEAFERVPPALLGEHGRLPDRVLKISIVPPSREHPLGALPPPLLVERLVVPSGEDRGHLDSRQAGHDRDPRGIGLERSARGLAPLACGADVGHLHPGREFPDANPRLEQELDPGTQEAKRRRAKGALEPLTQLKGWLTHMADSPCRSLGGLVF